MPENTASDNHSTFAPSLNTLSGDVRDFILDTIRPIEKPWTKLAEWEQAQLAQAIEAKARDVIRAVVDMISTRNFDHVEVQVGKGTFKEGEIEAKITCPDTDDNLIAIKNAGRCALVLADPQVFFGEKAKAKVDPDQPDLDLKPAEAESAPGGLPLDEAERLFRESNAKAEEKKARRRQRNDATRLTDEERGQTEGDEEQVEIPSAPRAPADADA
jgi:hypothetical protein